MLVNVWSLPSEDQFGLQNRTVSRSLDALRAHAFSVPQSCASNHLSLACTGEKSVFVCACVFIVPKNLAQFSTENLYCRT